MKVLILTTGSVSARLKHNLRESLEKDGHEVKDYCTENAKSIVDYDEKAKGYYSHINIRQEAMRWGSFHQGVEHINVVNWADVCIVCPADYNILGKAANGIADDFVSTVIAAWLGSEKPLWMAEAMNPMMYNNKVRKGNKRRLEEVGVNFIEPTVKKLACGDYGIGGLADIRAIKEIAVDGYRWICPISFKSLIGATKTQYLTTSVWASDRENCPKVVSVADGFNFDKYLPTCEEPGSFGARRKFDRHEGVDIYCKYGAEVHAVEDGEVVDSYQFTGTKETGEWWNSTWCLKIKGKTGVVTYGELQMPDEYGKIPIYIGGMVENVEFKYPKIGEKVRAGEFVGFVGKVLPDEKRRDDIRNHNNCMLHLELRKENCHIDGWPLGGDRDSRLMDPTPYLKMAIRHEDDVNDVWENGYWTRGPSWMKE